MLPLLIVFFVFFVGLILGVLAGWWWSRRDLTFTPSEWDELLSGLEDGTYKIKLERRQRGR